ncbi:MAG: hypothetical protein JW742_08000, partial [Candidatus Aminicenantes bacterium]|nr:hypothetical protein [Candidatus Aminicenantes bacterium]
LGQEAKEGKRRVKKLEDALAGYEAGDLVGRAESRVVTAVLAERGADAARALALAVIRRGDFVALVGARSGSRSHLILARSDALPIDLRPLAAELATLMNGKGGGSPSLVEIAGDPAADLDGLLRTAAAKIGP